MKRAFRENDIGQAPPSSDLALQKQLREQTNQIRMLSNDNRLLTQKLDLLKENLTELHSIREFLQQKLQDQEDASEKLEKTLERFKSDSASSLKKAEREKHSLEENLRKLEGEYRSVLVFLKETQGINEELEHQRNQIRTELAKAQIDQKQTGKKAKKAKKEKKKMRLLLEESESRMKELEEEMGDLHQKNLETFEENEELRETHERLKGVLNGKEAIIGHYSSLEEELKETKRKFEESQKEKEELTRSLKEKEQMLKELKEEVKKGQEDALAKEEEMVNNFDFMKREFEEKLGKMDGALRGREMVLRELEEEFKRLEERRNQEILGLENNLNGIRAILKGEVILKEKKREMEDDGNEREVISVGKIMGKVRKSVEKLKRELDETKEVNEERGRIIESLGKNERELASQVKTYEMDLAKYKEVNEGLFKKVEDLTNLGMKKEQMFKEAIEEAKEQNKKSIHSFHESHREELQKNQEEMEKLLNEISSLLAKNEETEREKNLALEAVEKQKKDFQRIGEELWVLKNQLNAFESKNSLLTFIISYLLSFINGLCTRIMQLRILKEMGGYFSLKYFVLLRSLRPPLEGTSLSLAKARKCFWATYVCCKLRRLAEQSASEEEKGALFLSDENFGVNSKIIDKSPLGLLIRKTPWSISIDSVNTVSGVFEGIDHGGATGVFSELDILGRLLLSCPSIHQQNFGVQRRFVFIHNFARSWHIPEMLLVNESRQRLKQMEDEVLLLGAKLKRQKEKDDLENAQRETLLIEEVNQLALELEEKSAENEELRDLLARQLDSLAEKTKEKKKIQQECNILSRTIGQYEMKIQEVSELLKNIQKDLDMKNATIERLDDILRQQKLLDVSGLLFDQQKQRELRTMRKKPEYFLEMGKGETGSDQNAPDGVGKRSWKNSEEWTFSRMNQERNSSKNDKINQEEMKQWRKEEATQSKREKGGRSDKEEEEELGARNIWPKPSLRD